MKKKTLINLDNLNNSGLPFNADTASEVQALCQLKYLPVLNISQTSLNSEGLGEIVKAMPELRTLDISNKNVLEIDYLLAWKEGLADLRLRDLNIQDSELLESHQIVIIELINLQTLNVTSEISYDEPFP